jgi:hypothetical protein
MSRPPQTKVSLSLSGEDKLTFVDQVTSGGIASDGVCIT